VAATDATVYKLSTGDPSDGGAGEQFFVDLKAFAALRDERDRAVSEKITLEKANSDLKRHALQKEDELTVALNHVNQVNGKEWIGKIIGQGDVNEIVSLKRKVQDLEKCNLQLKQLYDSVTQTNADLSNESQQKLEAALEDRNRLAKEKEHLEKANSDLIIHATRRQEELKQALKEAQQNRGVDSNHLNALQKTNAELKTYCQQMQDLNKSVKQANADITTESREKLEIALEEVKKANAAEKALTIEKITFVEELEKSKNIIDTMNKQLSEANIKNTASEQKIKEMEQQTKEYTEERETTKTLMDKNQGLYRLYQGRLAEISQLKIVNDRIARENTMWAKEIKEFRNTSACNNPEHVLKDGLFPRIREAFLNNSSIDEISKKSLSDANVCQLIINFVAEHVEMKSHYAKELHNSVEKLRSWGHKINEKELDIATMNKNFNNKDKAFNALNAKLINTSDTLKVKKEKLDDSSKQLKLEKRNCEVLSSKCQELSEETTKSKNELDMIKKLVVTESQKASRLDQMFQKAQQENEMLRKKLLEFEAELKQTQTDRDAAVEKIKKLKGLS
jgi:hypothetical protein